MMEGAGVMSRRSCFGDGRMPFPNWRCVCCRWITSFPSQIYCSDVDVDLGVPTESIPTFCVSNHWLVVHNGHSKFELFQTWNVTSTLVQVFCIFYQASQWNFLNFQKKKAARNHHASSWGWFRKQQQRGRGNGKRERGKQCTFSNFFFFLFNTFFLDVNGKK